MDQTFFWLKPQIAGYLLTDNAIRKSFDSQKHLFKAKYTAAIEKISPLASKQFILSYKINVYLWPCTCHAPLNPHPTVTKTHKILFSDKRRHNHGNEKEVHANFCSLNKEFK